MEILVGRNLPFGGNDLAGGFCRIYKALIVLSRRMAFFLSSAHFTVSTSRKHRGQCVGNSPLSNRRQSRAARLHPCLAFPALIAINEDGQLTGQALLEINRTQWGAITARAA